MARVRIKDHDRRPEFSIGLAVGAAVLMWFALTLWSSTSAVRANQRDLGQVSVTYECDDGHRFAGLADTKSSPCGQEGCRRRAWPIWSYQCTKHGAFLCQLRYELDDQQRPRIKKARPLGGSWTDVDEAINCPQCERTLLPDITLRLPAQAVGSEEWRVKSEEWRVKSSDHYWRSVFVSTAYRRLSRPVACAPDSDRVTSSFRNPQCAVRSSPVLPCGSPLNK